MTARDQSGMSTTEVLIMATVMSVLMIMVTESMNTLSGVRSEQRAAFRLGDVADRVARRVERDVDYSTRIFSNSAQDSEYLQAMDVGYDLLGNGARLPQLTANGYFEPDPPGVVETGNVLFVARRGPRVEVKYGMTGQFHVQSLVFVVTAPIPEATSFDLIRWISDPVVDYWDVNEITDPIARVDVLEQLYDNGVRYAWDSTSPRPTGLFEVTPSGTLSQLATDAFVSGGEAVDSSRPFGKRRMRLAGNGKAGRWNVPAYAKADGTFPCGFEIKIDGSAAGKLLMLRMIAESASPTSQDVAVEIQRFFSSQG